MFLTPHLSRHGKSWFSSASQFSGLKNVRKFMLFLSIKKCLNSHFFPFYWIFSNKFRLIVDIDVDLWALISKNWKKLVVYPKMSTILLKIVRKQCLHACDFFHVCVCVYMWVTSFQGKPFSRLFYVKCLLQRAKLVSLNRLRLASPKPEYVRIVRLLWKTSKWEHGSVKWK